MGNVGGGASCVRVWRTHSSALRMRFHQKRKSSLRMHVDCWKGGVSIGKSHHASHTLPQSITLRLQIGENELVCDVLRFGKLQTNIINYTLMHTRQIGKMSLCVMWCGMWNVALPYALTACLSLETCASSETPSLIITSQWSQRTPWTREITVGYRFKFGYCNSHPRVVIPGSRKETTKS